MKDHNCPVHIHTRYPSIIIKVDVAKDLLENPNIPVSIVASELGYSNFSHFTQMFKKHENVTPSEYRKQFHK